MTSLVHYIRQNAISGRYELWNQLLVWDDMFNNFYPLLVFPVSDLRKNEYLPRTFRKNFRFLLNPGYKKLPRKFMLFRRFSLQTNLTVKKKIIYAFQRKLRVFELTDSQVQSSRTLEEANPPP